MSKLKVESSLRPNESSTTNDHGNETVPSFHFITAYPLSTIIFSTAVVSHRTSMKFTAASMSFQILLGTLFILQDVTTTAFQPSLVSLGRRAFHVRAPLTLRAQIQSDEGTIMKEIRAMSVADIKIELSRLKTPFNDVFEKEGLIQRLHKARTETSNTRTTRATAPNAAPSTTSNRDVLRAPLYFTSLDTDVRIAAVNVEDGGITVKPAEKPYPTIRIDVPASAKGQSSFTLTLLLDTACSGLVLRPNVVKKYNLPSYKNPVSMTGAGGVPGTAGLTQLEKFNFADATFGPMPAAVQDIGGLPRDLDGIIGLSFLSQFAGVEMDFRKGVVSFFKTAQALEENNSNNNSKDDAKAMTVLAEADMSLVPRLGIYTVDVLLGGRGPVKMLVDSGAASSFLNWKGLADLGLERSSPAIVPIQGSMGAMGSDNMAIQLTHRIGVSSTLNLGRKSSSSSSYPGISLQDARLPIDIGQIPILDSVQGAGGILGVDALMRCAIVRLSFKGRPRLTFLN
jgi:predicted aspartyl protease